MNSQKVLLKLMPKLINIVPKPDGGVPHKVVQEKSLLKNAHIVVNNVLVKAVRFVDGEMLVNKNAAKLKIVQAASTQH